MLKQKGLIQISFFFFGGGGILLYATVLTNNYILAERTNFATFGARNPPPITVAG